MTTKFNDLMTHLFMTLLFVSAAFAQTPAPQEPIRSLPELCQWLTQDDAPVFGAGPIKRLSERLKRVANQPGKEKEAVRVRLQFATALLYHGRRAEAILQLDSAYAAAISMNAPGEIVNRIRRELGVAHLRNGEVNECIRGHNPERCLFPIRGQGKWTDPTSARRAIAYFNEFLRVKPKDTGVRWLLNIAHMAAGTYPDSLAPELRIPPAMIESKPEIGRFRDIAPALGLDAFNLAGSAIMDDFDNDGFLDVITSTWHPCEPLTYYHNNGDGTFSNWTKKANLQEQLGGLNLVQTDYNNDGRLDLMVFRGAWMGYKYGRQRNSLLRQNPDGTFTDVTFESGLGNTAYPCVSGAWADYDNDGDLDLYIGNQCFTTAQAMGGAPSAGEDDERADSCFVSELFRNNGDGTFTETAARAGVQNMAYATGVTWGDYDNDDDPDLYVSNLTGANHFYRNNGDGAFSEVAKDLGVAGDQSSWMTYPTWFFDVNNDGWLDLFVAGFGKTTLADVAADYLGLPNSGQRLRLYRNDGAGGFSDASKEMNLFHVRKTMGANYGDIDNDGFPDFYLGTGGQQFDVLMPNALYRNADGKHFVDVTTGAGVGHLQKGHGIAFGDLDNDGDQDIYAQMGGAFPDDRFHNALFENPGNGSHWITLKLVGVKSNRAAIGARIKLIVDGGAGERSIHGVVSSGGSFGASSLQQEIGVGAAKRIKRLEIYWPTSKIRQSFDNLAVDQFLEITEGAKVYRVLQRQPIQFGDTKIHDSPHH